MGLKNIGFIHVRSQFIPKKKTYKKNAPRVAAVPGLEYNTLIYKSNFVQSLKTTSSKKKPRVYFYYNFNYYFKFFEVLSCVYKIHIHQEFVDKIEDSIKNIT